MPLVYILIVLIAILGAPLFSVIAITAIVNFVSTGSSIFVVPQEIAGIASMPLLHSIPLFTFAGYLLANSKASSRIVRLTKAALGWMPGGLAIVTLLVCAVFTAFTGGSGVTIVALGGLLLPALLSEKYGEKYSLGLVTTSGSIGLLFPPSLPIIIFGVVSGALIDKLYIAGILPGILLIAVLSIHAAFMAKHYKVKRTAFSWKEFGSALLETKWEIPLPVFLFTGIYTGYLAISDAATFTVVYLLIAEVFLTRDIKLKDLPKIMKESMLLVGSILIILSVSLAATNYIIYTQLPQRIFEFIEQFITSKWMFLLLLNILLLIVGSIMDIFSALVVVVPLILPIAEAYNINLIHLGIVFLANLEIGYLTPPVGMNLFIASIRFNKSVVKLYKASLIFIGLLIGALMIITYVPELSTWFLEKPSIVGKWEYKSEDGMIDRLILKADKSYIRKTGSLMDIMMNNFTEQIADQKIVESALIQSETKALLQTGRYELNKDKLILSFEDKNEEFFYEIYNSGKKINLEKYENRNTVREKKFYTSILSMPLSKDAGNFIGKWITTDNELEFYFNGIAEWNTERYRYLVKGKNLTLIPYSEEADENKSKQKILFKYKFLSEKSLQLSGGKNIYIMNRTGSDNEE